MAHDTLFLYADWRADLSQRMDPVAPDLGEVVEPDHYILITHADGETDKIALRHKGSELSTALDLGYGYPTELYTSVTLKAGDSLQIFTTGLVKGAEDPVLAPILGSNKKSTVFLDFNAEKGNYTENYLSATGGSTWEDPTITVNDGIEEMFNIYIKFFSGGSNMAIYLEPAV